MERNLEEKPYSEDEKRVAKFFHERGVGGGDDPIGFILASYAYLVEERNDLRSELNRLRDNELLRSTIK